MIWSGVCRAAGLKGGEEESPGHHPVCLDRRRLGDVLGTCLLLLARNRNSDGKSLGQTRCLGNKLKAEEGGVDFVI